MRRAPRPHPRSRATVTTPGTPLEVPILPSDSDDEVVGLADATEFGLAAWVWSEDREHALRIARRLECGSVLTNVHRIGASDVSMPFGGAKGSGIGRGITALEGVHGTADDRRLRRRLGHPGSSR